MTRGTVSQTLLLLEKKGFVKKTIDTADRRVVHLSLLAKGREILEKATLNDLFSAASAVLDRDEMSGYDDMLLKLLNALQKSNKSRSFGLCKSCQYFTSNPNGYLCGLTKESLSETDSSKICQEHAAA